LPLVTKCGSIIMSWRADTRVRNGNTQHLLSRSSHLSMKSDDHNFLGFSWTNPWTLSGTVWDNKSCTLQQDAAW
jgi:hypothetical protein